MEEVDIDAEKMVLHSQIAIEDQLASFAEMTERPRIIFATNMAESSVTLPSVQVVIDLGMEKEMAFDDRLLVHKLQRKWISKASAKQRAGRTGRVCPGTVFRLYPESFYEIMAEFATSEVQRTPLEYLLLQAKQLEIGTPTTVLLRTIDAPDLYKVEEALARLFTTGAISTMEEDFELTPFGRLCSHLPLDLSLTKLIYFGLLFQVPLEAVVLSVAISSQDILTMPSTATSKSLRDYVDHVRVNFKTRTKFDRNQLSEPMMYLEVFKSFMASGKSPEFCFRRSVHLKRAKLFSYSVADVANSVHAYCKEQGLVKANRGVFDPLAMLYTKQVSFDPAAFRASPAILKLLLAITFDDNWLKCSFKENKDFKKISTTSVSHR